MSCKPNYYRSWRKTFCEAFVIDRNHTCESDFLQPATKLFEWPLPFAATFAFPDLPGPWPYHDQAGDFLLKPLRDGPKIRATLAHAKIEAVVKECNRCHRRCGKFARGST